MKLFLDNLDTKIEAMNREGPRSIERCSEFLMSLCCDKILPVPQSNFIQYIPLYVILKAKPYFTRANGPVNKSSCVELLFSTCFISELIHRSFPSPIAQVNKIGKT